MAILTTDSQNYEDIADAIRAKTGSQATMKPGQMATAIASIPSGGGVDLGNGREISNSDAFQYPGQNFTFSLPSTVLDIGFYALNNALQYCSSVTKVDLSSLTSVTGNYGLYMMCRGCANLTSLDLSSLTTISGNNALDSAFYNCNKLASVDLSSLASVTASSAFSSAFYNCTALPSMSFGSLTSVTGAFAFNNAFSYCTSLASLSFPALTADSFGSFVTQFNNMLYGVTGCTVHFPAAIQSTIGSWSSVTGGFGGTNTTVSFDL